jgi:elongation of very long chain fatty acids protein 6
MAKMAAAQQHQYTFIPLKLQEPEYMTTYEFEKNFDLDAWRKWMSHNWNFSVYASIAYVIFIFGTKFVMRNRQPYRFTGLLTTWNAILAVFFTVAFLRTLPEFINIMAGKNGFHNSVCEWHGHNYSTAFWSWLLLMSKVVELGDTAFVVLRKQHLLFLHWYHHVTTLLSWWVMYEAYEPNQLWYIVMNSFVHSVMYSYYALRAMGVRVPRNCAMAITFLQLLQMVFGIIVNVYAWNLMYIQGNEAACPHRGFFGLKVSFGIYVTYFFLFAHFFYTSYFKKSGRKGASGSKVSTNGHAAAETNGKAQNGHSTKKVE